MKPMGRAASAVAVVIVGLACGVDEAGQDSTVNANPSITPAVQLLPITQLPGCYQEATPSLSSRVDSDVMAQRIQMAEMKESFALQYVMLLVKPLLADPGALSWSVSNALWDYAASSVVRGDHWGVIEAGWESNGESPGPYRLLHATMRYSATEDSYDLREDGVLDGYLQGALDGVLMMKANAIRLGNHGHACDPETGVLVDMVPWSQAGHAWDAALVCRRAGTGPGAAGLCRQAANTAWRNTVNLAELPVFILD